MVKLEEVADEAFANAQNLEDEGDWDTDSESDTSSISEAEDSLDESLLDRLIALKDIIPPTSRGKIQNTVNTTASWGWWGVQGAARLSWWVGVSAMLIGIPYAVGYSEDQQIAAEEKQYAMQQQANEVMAPGATSQTPGKSSGGQPAL